MSAEIAMERPLTVRSRPADLGKRQQIFDEHGKAREYRLCRYRIVFFQAYRLLIGAVDADEPEGGVHFPDQRNGGFAVVSQLALELVDPVTGRDHFNGDVRWNSYVPLIRDVGGPPGSHEGDVRPTHTIRVV